MISGFGSIIKQAQQMKADLEKAQQDIARIEVTGTAGAGMVTVVMTGKHDIKRVTIEPELMSGDKNMLEDLIAAAVNDANRRVEGMTREKMSDITAMGWPPGMKLPF